MDTAKKQAVHDFNVAAHEFLTEYERQHLFKVLKQYQRRHRVDRLVEGICQICRPQESSDLIECIQRIIPEIHQPEFDRLVKHNFSQRAKRKYLQVTGTVSSRSSNRTYDDVSMTGDVHVITLHSDPTQQGLGFSIRGGSEHGLSIYVSDIDKGSVADAAGLQIGDKIVEVNNISLHNVASSSAVKVLSGSTQLKLMLERTGHVPEWRLSKEKTAWHDSHNKQLISGDFEQCGTMHFIRGLDVEVPERRVTLSNKSTLGLNIRGGNEYGLGIYISSVDAGSEAEQNGVRVGDQVIDVNGVPFDNIPHTQAVDVLKSDSHLIMTLRDVGRYPAYKELYAEYTWSKNESKSPRDSGSSMSETKLSDTWIDIETKPRNPSLHMKVPVQVLSKSQKSGDISHIDSYATLHGQSDGLPLQSEIYLPNTSGNTNSTMSLNATIREEDVEDDEDDMGSVSLDLWQKSDGHYNDAYVSDKNSDRASSQSDTDDESGILGEYDITMEDIISRADNPENFHFEHMKRNSVTSNVIKEGQISFKNSKIDLDSDGKGRNDDRISQDEAVCILSPINSSENESNTESIQAEIHLESEDDQIHKSTNELKQSKSNDPDETDSSANSVSSYHSSFRSTPCKIIEYGVEKHHSDVRSTPSPPPTSTLDTASPSHFKLTDSTEEQHERYFNPYTEMERQISTGFSVLDADNCTDEDATMANFDEQILSMESKASSVIEMDTLSSGNKADEMKSHSVAQESPMAGETKKSTLGRKTGKWQMLRDKLKGSLRVKGKSKRTNDVQRGNPQESKFERSFVTLSSQVMPKSTVSNHSIKILEESARKFLSPEELPAVMKHVKAYHDNHDIERLVDVLLTLLDRPEKILLLRDIRTVIYPIDLYRFEQLVNIHEVKAYEKLSTKLHLYLNHDKKKKPKRNLLVTEIDEFGRFYVKTVEQVEKEHKTKQMVVDVMKGQPLKGWQETQSTPDRSDSGCYTGDNPDSSIITAYIPKEKPTLGLCVSGGSESKKQPQIKVESVIEGGAAADVSRIKAGMIILSIDDESMVGAKHKAAVEALRRSFGSKANNNMKIIMQAAEV